MRVNGTEILVETPRDLTGKHLDQFLTFMAHQIKCGEDRRTTAVIIEMRHAAIRGFEKRVSATQGLHFFAFNLKRNGALRDHAHYWTWMKMEAGFYAGCHRDPFHFHAGCLYDRIELRGHQVFSDDRRIGGSCADASERGSAKDGKYGNGVFHVAASVRGPGLAVQCELCIVRFQIGIDMELRHLRSFLAVADELHFGRAADRIGATQSAVSRHLQLLEAELGYVLLTRSSRSVTLSAAGKALRSRITSHVEAMDRAVDEARAISAASAGRLRVGYVANLSYVFLPRLLDDLRRRVPDAAFELHESPTPRQIDALNAGRMDVGIALAPLDDPSLMQRGLFEERLIVMMREDHPLARRKNIELRTLANEPFVICPRYIRTGLHEVVRQRCREAGFTPNVVQEVGGRALLEELIAAGVGISLVPESASHIPRTRVAFVPLRGRVEPIRVHLIWKKGNAEPLLPLFLELAGTCAEEWRAGRNTETRRATEMSRA